MSQCIIEKLRTIRFHLKSSIDIFLRAGPSVVALHVLYSKIYFKSKVHYSVIPPNSVVAVTDDKWGLDNSSAESCQNPMDANMRRPHRRSARSPKVQEKATDVASTW